MTQLFPHHQSDLSGIAARLLDQARHHGATDASASIFESQAQSVHMRQNRIQAMGKEIQNGISLTVFIGQCQGSTHSTDLSTTSLDEMAVAACNIARHTQADACAGLPEAKQFRTEQPDLDLLHPWQPDSETLIDLTRRIEQGITPHPGTLSDGAWASAWHGQLWLANTRNFSAGYAFSNHALSARVLAQKAGKRQIDYWSSQERAADNLSDAEQVGAEAARRAEAALDIGPVRTGTFPVLFEARAAISLLGHLTQAISGRPLYMQTSFLGHSFDTQVFSDHICVIEDPFIRSGQASAPFDADGLSGKRRAIVDRGILRGAFLGHYAARRLGCNSTGNASGPYNLLIQSSLTQSDDTLQTMLGKLDTGLYVTALAGDGVRLINGDYSRAASGFWVEHGEVRHAVDGVTLAGNLREMWQGIQAIGADCRTEGPYTTGSILIDHMHIAGE